MFAFRDVDETLKKNGTNTGLNLKTKPNNQWVVLVLWVVEPTHLANDLLAKKASGLKLCFLKYGQKRIELCCLKPPKNQIDLKSMIWNPK